MGLFKSIMKNMLTSEETTDLAFKAAGKLFERRNPLKKPAPPEVPQMPKSMSVMVAVNGETYGPYEKPTLLEMIGDGSLTLDTYVFIEGMDSWKPAKEVPIVLALFKEKGPVPPTPPKPWAQSEPQPAINSQKYGNSFSDRLNQLINAAVADGEITDMERQVLIRNAQQEGVSMDEFVMVLEAKLYERQLELINNENEKRVKFMEASKNSPSSSVQQAPTSSAPVKCPHCGAPTKMNAFSCPECGNDYPPSITKNLKEKSSWEKLSEKLEEIDANPNLKVSIWNNQKNKEKRKAIQQFPLPTSKDDIVDFFCACAPLTRNEDIGGAFRDKCVQIFEKSQILIDDPGLLRQLTSLANKYNIRLEEEEDKE